MNNIVAMQYQYHATQMQCNALSLTRRGARDNDSDEPELGKR